ncbi:chaperone protein dnaJ 11, chloroplastic [Typha angustifolia]|uniref:chaperone protein dnaJ 11, chloroplastic n=1 Tax=Typha angustifolia TaxID=59011 RepID=UPI003C2DDC60
MITALSISYPNPRVGLRISSPPPCSPIRSSPRASAAAAAPSAAVVSSPSTLYDVLGLQAGASGRDIKAAYRRLAREYHPDVVASERKNESTDEFIRIHAAYATLSDPDKRADYDRDMMVAAVSGPRWSPRGQRPFSSYASRSPLRTWETDQCW